MPILGSNSSGGSRPSAPVIGSATDGGTGTTVSVAFTPSTYIGKGTITYTATSSPGSLTGTASSSPITVTGLTTSTAYTFTIQGTTNYGVTSTASSASNSVTPVVPPSFESIATATVTTGGVRTLDFSSIPSGYSSLQVRGIVRVTAPSETSMRSMLIKLNDSTSTTSAYHWITGNGTSATASANSGTTSIYANVLIPTGAGANPDYGAFTMDLIDYASTTKNKTMRMFFGGNHSGYSADNVIWLQSALWIDTSAVNRLTFNSPSFDFVTGSTFALYGIKG